MKLISLAPNLSNFKLYATSLARAAATCKTSACAALPHLAGEDPLEANIANDLLPWAAADFAPEEGGVVDEDTYVQQGRDLERAYSLQVINYVLGTLQPDTDLAMVGYPFTDEVSHQFMGLVSPTEPGGVQNPCYDVNPKFDDVAVHRPRHRRPRRRSARATSAAPTRTRTRSSHVTRELMGGDPTTFAGSDHGFAPQSLRRQRAQGLARQDGELDGAGRGRPARDAADRLAARERPRRHGELPRQQPRHRRRERRLRLG